jgi:hypothetical protein
MAIALLLVAVFCGIQFQEARIAKAEQKYRGLVVTQDDIDQAIKIAENCEEAARQMSASYREVWRMG